MKKLKIVTIGAFLKGQSACNGQTHKVRNYARAVKSYYRDSLTLEIDTSLRLKSLLYNIPLFLFGLFWGNVIIFLPCENSLKIVFPLIYLAKKIKGFLFLYPVVGGWLPVFLKEHIIVSHMLKSMDKIFVETAGMMDQLRNEGFRNVEIIPVFTLRKPLSEDYWGKNFSSILKEPYAFCTFSRVTRDKGVEIAIDAINYLNIQSNVKRFLLDIYGSVDLSYKNAFLDKVSKSPFNAIRYCGEIHGSKVISTLSHYASLLFPTFYPGEGFPTSIQEAFLAGLPVIASDWRYNKELVKDNWNGLLFDIETKEKGLAEKIALFVSDNDRALAMHNNSLTLSERYTPEKSLRPFFSAIDSFLGN